MCSVTGTGAAQIAAVSSAFHAACYAVGYTSLSFLLESIKGALRKDLDGHVKRYHE